MTDVNILLRCFLGCVLTVTSGLAELSSQAQAPESDGRQSVNLADARDAAGQPIRNKKTLGGIRFTLAEGLEIERVADEKLIRWPVVADWDSEGRLVVVESGGVASPIVEHNKQGLHRIVRLVDSDDDGMFDRRIVAADGLAFTEGVLCLGDRILAAAPPVIWELTDSDGDGVCEKRDVWFDGSTVTHCANDLHGPYLGRDGWVYWCKGAFGEQTREWRDGRTLKSKAAHIFRRPLSGGAIEPLVSGGMDNPVEMVFLPEGEKFFTSTFLQHPGGGKRDGIAHAVYGGVHGKDHSVIDNMIRTGPLMPIMTHLGPAAPSGLFAPRLHQWGPAAQGGRTLVAALFNLQKLTAHQLIPDGSSFRSADHDLVVADRVDFHPTDVLEDADGSLLLIDTGGWYDLCCPTSRIDQKTASGGIYRITDRRATPPVAKVTPQGDKANGLDVSELFDPRPWVRREASAHLSTSGDAIAPLEAILGAPNRSRDDRLDAMWLLCRIERPEVEAIIGRQLELSEPSLVHAACHIASIRQFASLEGRLRETLTHEDRGVRRAAAEALGRVGGNDSIPSLLEAIDQPDVDHHLRHSLLYSLIELSRRDGEVNVFELATSEGQKEAAIRVADQTNRIEWVGVGGLFDALSSAEEGVRLTAAEVLANRPHFAAKESGRLQPLWDAIASDEEGKWALLTILKGWKSEPATGQLIQRWFTGTSRPNRGQRLFLTRHLAEIVPSGKIPADWVPALTRWLENDDAEVTEALLTAFTSLRMDSVATSDFTGSLERMAIGAGQGRASLHLLGAIPAGQRIESEDLESQVVDAFQSGRPGEVALAAAVLARAKLSQTGVARLADRLSEVSTTYLSVALEAIRRGDAPQVDHQVLVSLTRFPPAKTLPPGFLVNLYKDASGPIRAQAKKTDAELSRRPDDLREAVDEALRSLPPGDPVRGLQVFRGSKAACSACHRMGYVGSDIGPVLTKIGASRTPEALIEAILFPSARQEQSYRATRVLTNDGRVFSGLVKERSGGMLEIRLDAQRTVTLAGDEVEALSPSETSIMPRGLDQQLSRQELADLLTLLKNAK